MKCHRRTVFTTLLASLILAAAGCRTAYYSAWETLGKHKRDLLKDNVEEARDDQQEASQQFKDALTRLREIYTVDAGELEEKYDQLQSDYDDAAEKADDVRERIAQVERVATDLFKEWEEEIESMASAKLKSSSRDKLYETREKYRTLHSAMKRAEESMEPVLTQFRDQVLFLKHNLNAQAIGALRGETLDIEKEIEQLIRDINASIAEADAFIQEME